MTVSEDAVFEQVRRTITDAVTSMESTVEVRAAATSVFLTFAMALAENEPQEVREYWAKQFYRYGDELAAKSTGDDK